MMNKNEVKKDIRSYAKQSQLNCSELAKGEPGLLYGIFGEEDFLVALSLQNFLTSPVFTSNSSLNIERFQAGITAPNRILESAYTLPFLSNRRLVVVDNCDQYKAEHLKQFLPYIKKPVATTCLIFVGVKLDQRLIFAKALAKFGYLYIFKKLYPNEIAPWLIQRARIRGKQLLPEAARHLVEFIHLGLGALDSEIEKLSLFVGERNKIMLSDVLIVTGKSRFYSIFDFIDALTVGSLERALVAYNHLKSLGEPANKILAMVVRLFKQIIIAQEIINSGGGNKEIQQKLGLPLAAARVLFNRIQRQEKQREPIVALKRILAADIMLKSSFISDQEIINSLIIDLCLSVNFNYS